MRTTLETRWRYPDSRREAAPGGTTILLLAGLCILLACAAPIRAETDGYGALAGLRAGFGTAALSYGNAFSAIADDPTALVYNPAGLAQVVRYAVTAGSVAHGAGSFADRAALDQTRPYAAFAWTTAKAGTFAALWRHNGTEGIEQRTSRDGPGLGTFDYSENWFSVGWSYGIIPRRFLFGATVNWAQMGYSLSGVADASAIGTTVGVLYTGVPLLRLGAAVESSMSLSHDDGRKDQSPGRSRGGLAVGPLGNWLTLAVDLEQVSGEPLHMHGGARLQYRPSGSSVLRSAYLGGGIANFSIEDRGSGLDVENGRRYTAGAGLAIGLGKGRIEAGYALTSGRFGLDHTLSVSLQGTP